MGNVVPAARRQTDEGRGQQRAGGEGNREVEALMAQLAEKEEQVAALHSKMLQDRETWEAIACGREGGQPLASSSSVPPPPLKERHRGREATGSGFGQSGHQGPGERIWVRVRPLGW